MRKLWCILLLGMVLGQSLAWGQLAIHEPKNEQLLVQADRYLERQAYRHAVALYQRILNQGHQSQVVMLKTAYCYRKINDHRSAAFWYQEAMKQETSPNDLWLDLAACQKSLGDYQKAYRTYDEYLKAHPDDGETRKFQMELVTLSLNTVKSVQVSRLNLQLPGPAFAPTYWKDGLVVVAPGKTGGVAKAVSTWSEDPYYDLYFVNLNDSKRTSDQYLSKKINSRYHEGPAAFYDKGSRIIFTRSSSHKHQSSRHLKLMTARQKKNGKWTKPKPLRINQENVSMGHPAISADGKTLYFVSNAPGGYGGTDIYRSEWSPSGWQDPVNMGSEVNSAKDEMFPTLNGAHLFYSSNGKGGFGGQDIWIYHLPSKTILQNLGAPFNSPSDDFGLILQGRQGFFSSNRSGQDAIYKVTH